MAIGKSNTLLKERPDRASASDHSPMAEANGDTRALSASAGSTVSPIPTMKADAAPNAESREAPTAR